MSKASTLPSFAEITGPRGLESFVFLKRAKQIGFLPMLVELWKKFGDWVVVSSPTGQKIYIVNNARGAEEILYQKSAHFVKGKSIEAFKLLIGNGLPVSEGESWRKQRRLVQPSFHRSSIETYVPVMLQVTEEHLDRWLDQQGQSGRLNADQLIAQLTHDIIARTMFGTDLGERLPPMQAAWTEALDFIVDRSMKIVKLPLWIPTARNRRYKQAMDFVFDTVDGIIDERVTQKKEGVRSDLLQRLLNARDSEGTAQRMTDREVRDQILAFLFAGHETTASNIGFTLWKILENPEIEQKVREELQSVLGSEAPSYETLFRLTYLRKVVYEALRLYPAASMFVRQAVSDVEVAGHRFRKGSLFILAPYVIHRRPELWPDPLRFDPDRFNEPPNSGETTRYFAFGAGPRVCIGEQFAVLEAQLVIARLLQTLDLKLVPGEPVRELFRGTLQPSGLTVAVSRRAH